MKHKNLNMTYYAENLKIQESDTVLEIGSGWGGFAEYAASNYGCSVKGITISKEQLNFSNERILKKIYNKKLILNLLIIEILAVNMIK